MGCSWFNTETIKTCIKYVDKKSPAKNLQISSCSIATLLHVCIYKVQFCAFKGDVQNLPPSSSPRLTGMNHAYNLVLIICPSKCSDHFFK